MWTELQHEIDKIIRKESYPLITKIIRKHNPNCEAFNGKGSVECNCNYIYEIVIKEN